LLITAGARLRQRMLNREPVAVLLFALLLFAMFYNWSEAMFSNLTPAWFLTLLAVLSATGITQPTESPAARWARYRRPQVPPGVAGSSRLRTGSR
jgi:hypothetical protein